MTSPPDFDLWKTARAHVAEMQKALREADKLPLADQRRLLLLKDARDRARAYAEQLDRNIIAETHHNERGISFYNVSMLDNSAEPILVG